MRILLVAALCATAYGAGEICSDSDGDASVATDPVSCDAGTYYDISGGDADISTSGDGGKTECCTNCATGYATCTAAATGQTCSAGYGLETASTPGACTACEVGVNFKDGANDAICAPVTAANTVTATLNDGERVKAATATTDNVKEDCTRKNNGSKTCPTDAGVDATCLAGFGLAGGNTCTACTGTTFSVGDTNTCEERATATTGTDNDGQAGVVGKFVSATGNASTDNTLTDCRAGALTCSSDTDDDTCFSKGWWLNAAGGAGAGVCTTCTAQAATYVHANLVLTCSDANAATVESFTCDGDFWDKDGDTTLGCEEPATAACGDGFFEETALTKTADRVCTACRTNALTCTSAAIDLTCTADTYFLDADAANGATCTICPQLTTAPANTTAHTTTCDAADGANAAAATVTCADTHEDTNTTAADGCEAEKAAADPASPAASPASDASPAGSASESVADEESSTSPAFIVGTAIAGIALLL